MKYDCVNELELLIKSRYPVIYFEAREEERIERIVSSVAKAAGLFLYTWTITEGMKGSNSTQATYDSQSPVRALNNIGACSGKNIYLLKDFHRHLGDPVVIRKMKDVAKALTASGSVIIISADTHAVPEELGRLIAHITLQFPREDEIRDTVLKALQNFRRFPAAHIEVTPELLDSIVMNMKGFTLFEVERSINRMLSDDAKITENDLPLLFAAKKESVARQGILEYYDPEIDLPAIGGLPHLKKWLEKRKCVFQQPEKVASFGLEPPKGVLVTGVQGCGKSLCAKTIAKEWQIPLLKLDAGALYNKYIGESENNLRRALRMADSIAPVVLWVDEIEKGFSYSPGEDGDSGTSKRIFGTFLTWLQEKKAAVFVVATSNDISRLPPELLRKGRFDEIFFVDLPDAADREEIFRIHLKKRRLAPESFDLKKLTDMTAGFSGAEIEQAVISALYGAFSANRELCADMIIEEIKSTKPLSVSMKEKIDSLREWAQDRTVKA